MAVCDDATSTTIVAADVLRDGLASGRRLIVTARSESAATTYLLYDGWRAQVDLRNRPVVRALKLDGVARGLFRVPCLDATPEATSYRRPAHL